MSGTEIGRSICETVSPEEVLQQGDFVLWPGATAFLEQAGIIVTADCDLAFGKHWGRISVVPVFALSTYVEELLAPRVLSKQLTKLREAFGRQIQRVLAPSDESIPSDAAIDPLLSASTLPQPLAGETSLVNLHSVLRQALGYERSVPNLECLARAIALVNAGSGNTLRSHIKNGLSSLPGDVLAVPRIDGLPFTAGVAWLRVIREVPEASIARKMSDMAPGRCIRIGRLIPVLRYRLTQMLGQVFSDIGLPENYELLKRELIDSYTAGVA